MAAPGFTGKPVVWAFAGEHEFFAGSALLMDMLKQTPGVFPVMARDGWPKDEKIFTGAKAVVFSAWGRLLKLVASFLSKRAPWQLCQVSAQVAIRWLLAWNHMQVVPYICSGA